MKNNYRIITNSDSMRIPLLFKSILVGIGAGGIAVLYRITLSYAEKISFGMYDFVRAHMVLIPVLFAVLCLAGYFVGFLVSKNSMISGSGIPQVKGILSGYFMNRKSWLHTLLSKFLGGTVALLAGLSLGREGPSIQLGACVAEGIGKKTANSRLERKILIASGASAGLAAAFGAPLAGVIFALEEIFKYFSPIILLSTMSAAVTSDFISRQIFGIAPIFNFTVLQTIPLKDYWLLVILGILLGLAGALYNTVLFKTQKIYKSIKFLNTRTRIIIPFIAAGIFGIAFPVVLGGGHRIIEELNLNNGIGILLIILIAKFVFSMISFGSGTPGGIFFPLLIIGGTIGAVFSGIIIKYFGYDASLFYNFVILAMAGYFTAIVRAPITGVVLIMEMTGSFTQMLSLTVVAVTAYIIADLVKSPPVYDELMKNLIANEGIKEQEHSKKVIAEFVVQHGSTMENKQIRMIEWPERALLVNVKRNNREILPKGDTVLKAGDYLVVLTDINNEAHTRDKIEKLNETE